MLFRESFRISKAEKNIKNSNFAIICHDNENNSLKSLYLMWKMNTRPLLEDSGFFDEPSIFAASLSVYFYFSHAKLKG